MYNEEEYRALEKAYFSDEAHEQDVLRVLSRLLSGKTLFADVGASLGQFTRSAAQVMRHGRIVAIEADPDRAVRLETNCKSWASATGCEIMVLHAAAAERDAPVTFFTTDSRVSGGLFVHDTSGSAPGVAGVHWREITVPGRRLDALFDERAPDVIKMDIEGAEFRALRGAEGILRQGQTVLLVEVHDWTEPSGEGGPAAVRALMRAYGYLGIALAGKTLFVPRAMVTTWVPLVVQSLAQRVRRTLGRILGL